METSEISGYHIHIYYAEAEGLAAARALRDALAARFEVELGMWRETAGSPHPTPMFQVNFAAPLFAEILPWLMLNRGGLDVLVHPETGDDVADHGDFALWLGQVLPIDFEALRAFMEIRRKREAQEKAGGAPN